MSLVIEINSSTRLTQTDQDVSLFLVLFGYFCSFWQTQPFDTSRRKNSSLVGKAILTVLSGVITVTMFVIILEECNRQAECIVATNDVKGTHDLNFKLAGVTRL